MAAVPHATVHASAPATLLGSEGTFATVQYVAAQLSSTGLRHDFVQTVYQEAALSHQRDAGSSFQEWVSGAVLAGHLQPQGCGTGASQPSPMPLVELLEAWGSSPALVPRTDGVSVLGVHVPLASSERRDAARAVISASTLAVSAECMDEFVTEGVETAQQNLRRLLHVIALCDAPVLLEGPAGAGKTATLRHAARLCGFSSDLVELHLDDSSDGKSLLGAYVCSEKPGEFQWQHGPVALAAMKGGWLVIENMDRAPLDVIAALTPLLKDRRMPVPGRDDVVAHADFRLLATRTTLSPICFSARGTLSSSSFPILSCSESIAGALATVLPYLARVAVQPLQVSPLGTLTEPLAGELAGILLQRKPALPRRIVAAMIQAYSLLAHFSNPVADASLSALQAAAGVAPGSLATPLLSGLRRFGRTMSPRMLFQWRRRLALLLPPLLPTEHAAAAAEPYVTEQWRRDAAMQGLHVFGDHVPDAAVREQVLRCLCACFQLDAEHTVQTLVTNKPELVASGDVFRIGGVALPRARGHDALAADVLPGWFSPTRHGLAVLETVASAVATRDHVLLVGETGIGKTSAVQALATMTGNTLVALNMNMQTESGDLLGGFKPVTVQQLAVPLLRSFKQLLARTFSESANASFVDTLDAAASAHHWAKLDRGLRRGCGMALSAVAVRPNSAPLLQQWQHMQHSVSLFGRHVAADDTPTGSAAARRPPVTFAYVEGALVRAMREGHWILLDEINLASPDVLQRLVGLMDAPVGQPLVSEGTAAPPAYRHPACRIFAAMNPSTDVGKRDLPPAVRTRFAEVYVSDVVDAADIGIIVQAYLRHVPLPVGQAPMNDAIVKFYLRAKDLSSRDKGVLRDGAGKRAAFALRSLARALTVAAQFCSRGFSAVLAVREGLHMCFFMQLDATGQALLSAVMDACLPLAASAAASSAAASSAPMVRSTASSTSIHIGPYSLSAGPIGSVDYAQSMPGIPPRFILVPSAQRVLLPLARAVMCGRFPILLQGPTSSGKTSIVEYLAALIGHRCIRINNHEHTDIAEYMGAYATDATGGLRFMDGLLVTALRHGHWLILDELNLAPTDVLEALNRLLDDNRELLLPETQETIKPHPNFMLFATQNPAGMYGGRKELSLAFRNRFVEIHVDEVPDAELATILSQRSQLPRSFVDAMVGVASELRRLRQGSNVFAGSHGFITTRDLLKWAHRRPSTYAELARHGYMLLAERLRSDEEKNVVARVLAAQTRTPIVDVQALYDSADPSYVIATAPSGIHAGMKRRAGANAATSAAVDKRTRLTTTSADMPAWTHMDADTFRAHCWARFKDCVDVAAGGTLADPTDDMPVPGTEGLSSVTATHALRRVFTLVMECIAHDEPVLLVGETGAGKTSVLQLLSLLLRTPLRVINCHAHTETSDFIGGYKPVRSRAAMRERAIELLQRVAAALPADARARVLAEAPVLLHLNADTVDGVDVQTLRAGVERVESLLRVHAPGDVAELVDTLAAITAVFTWYDGPLVTAMRAGEWFLIDEASLAEDAVLERLNSVLEPSHSLTLAEKASTQPDGDPTVYVRAGPGFRVCATMNPGGDFGKRELSPALRNRFTEIYVPAITHEADVRAVVTDKMKARMWSEVQPAVRDQCMAVCNALTALIMWFHKHAGACIDERAVVASESQGTNLHLGVRALCITMRDVDAWCRFMTACVRQHDIPVWHAAAHAACVCVLDGLGLGVGLPASAVSRIRDAAVQQWLVFTPADHHDAVAAICARSSCALPLLTQANGLVGMQPFLSPRGHVMSPYAATFAFQAPTSARNAYKLFRALCVQRAVLLEGDPGVGKSALVAALANACGHPLIRINMSEHTDMGDLFGQDVPVHDAAGDSPAFAWRDGPLMEAMRAGAWVLLDELNLAPQSVCEGLNGILDHRGCVYIPDTALTITPAAGFRVFATQNPLAQGYGRKGLPASFINRFTRVYVDALTRADYECAARTHTPSLATVVVDAHASLLDVMTDFVLELNTAVDSFASGAPWDVNLRDLLRWCGVVQAWIATHPAPEVRTPAADRPAWLSAALCAGVHTLFIARLRSQVDRRAVVRMLVERLRAHKLPCPLTFIHDAPAVAWTEQGVLQLDDVTLNLAVSTDISVARIVEVTPARALTPSLARVMYHCAAAIALNVPVLLVGGPAAARSTAVHTLARAAGIGVRELHITPASETADMLGSYEQMHAYVFLCAAARACATALRAIVGQNVRSLHQSDALQVRSIMDELQQVCMTVDTHERVAALIDALRSVLQRIRGMRSTSIDTVHPSLLHAESLVARLPSQCDGVARFGWVDGPLTHAYLHGEWICVHGVNVCTPAVMDRLNAVCEAGGTLDLLHADGSRIPPHPSFRIFLCMDPRSGPVSRALRNRCVEVYVAGTSAAADVSTDADPIIRSCGARLQHEMAQAVQDVEEVVAAARAGEGAALEWLRTQMAADAVCTPMRAWSSLARAVAQYQHTTELSAYASVYACLAHQHARPIAVDSRNRATGPASGFVSNALQSLTTKHVRLYQTVCADAWSAQHIHALVQISHNLTLVPTACDAVNAVAARLCTPYLDMQLDADDTCVSVLAASLARTLSHLPAPVALTVGQVLSQQHKLAWRGLLQPAFVKWQQCMLLCDDVVAANTRASMWGSRATTSADGSMVMMAAPLALRARSFADAAVLANVDVQAPLFSHDCVRPLCVFLAAITSVIHDDINSSEYQHHQHSVAVCLDAIRVCEITLAQLQVSFARLDLPRQLHTRDQAGNDAVMHVAYIAHAAWVYVCTCIATAVRVAALNVLPSSAANLLQLALHVADSFHTRFAGMPQLNDPAITAVTTFDAALIAVCAERVSVYARACGSTYGPALQYTRDAQHELRAALQGVLSHHIRCDDAAVLLRALTVLDSSAMTRADVRAMLHDACALITRRVSSLQHDVLHDDASVDEPTAVAMTPPAPRVCMHFALLSEREWHARVAALVHKLAHTGQPQPDIRADAMRLVARGEHLLALYMCELGVHVDGLEPLQTLLTALKHMITQLGASPIALVVRTYRGVWDAMGVHWHARMASFLGFGDSSGAVASGVQQHACVFTDSCIALDDVHTAQRSRVRSIGHSAACGHPHARIHLHAEAHIAQLTTLHICEALIEGVSTKDGHCDAFREYVSTCITAGSLVPLTSSLAEQAIYMLRRHSDARVCALAELVVAVVQRCSALHTCAAGLHEHDATATVDCDSTSTVTDTCAAMASLAHVRWALLLPLSSMDEETAAQLRVRIAAQSVSHAVARRAGCRAADTGRVDALDDVDQLSCASGAVAECEHTCDAPEVCIRMAALRKASGGRDRVDADARLRSLPHWRALQATLASAHTHVFTAHERTMQTIRDAATMSSATSAGAANATARLCASIARRIWSHASTYMHIAATHAHVAAVIAYACAAAATAPSPLPLVQLVPSWSVASVASLVHSAPAPALHGAAFASFHVACAAAAVRIARASARGHVFDLRRSLLRALAQAFNDTVASASTTVGSVKTNVSIAADASEADERDFQARFPWYTDTRDDDARNATRDRSHSHLRVRRSAHNLVCVAGAVVACEHVAPADLVDASLRAFCSIRDDALTTSCGGAHTHALTSAAMADLGVLTSTVAAPSVATLDASTICVDLPKSATLSLTYSYGAAARAWNAYTDGAGAAAHAESASVLTRTRARVKELLITFPDNALLLTCDRLCDTTGRVCVRAPVAATCVALMNLSQALNAWEGVASSAVSVGTHIQDMYNLIARLRGLELASVPAALAHMWEDETAAAAVDAFPAFLQTLFSVPSHAAAACTEACVAYVARAVDTFLRVCAHGQFRHRLELSRIAASMLEAHARHTCASTCSSVVRYYSQYSVAVETALVTFISPHVVALCEAVKLCVWDTRNATTLRETADAGARSIHKAMKSVCTASRTGVELTLSRVYPFSHAFQLYERDHALLLVNEALQASQRLLVPPQFGGVLSESARIATRTVTLLQGAIAAGTRAKLCRDAITACAATHDVCVDTETLLTDRSSHAASRTGALNSVLTHMRVTAGVIGRMVAHSDVESVELVRDAGAEHVPARVRAAVDMYLRILAAMETGGVHADIPARVSARMCAYARAVIGRALAHSRERAAAASVAAALTCAAESMAARVQSHTPAGWSSLIQLSVALDDASTTLAHARTMLSRGRFLLRATAEITTREDADVRDLVISGAVATVDEALAAVGTSDVVSAAYLDVIQAVVSTASDAYTLLEDARGAVRDAIEAATAAANNATECLPADAINHDVWCHPARVAALVQQAQAVVTQSHSACGALCEQVRGMPDVHARSYVLECMMAVVASLDAASSVCASLRSATTAVAPLDAPFNEAVSSSAQACLTACMLAVQACVRDPTQAVAQVSNEAAQSSDETRDADAPADSRDAIRYTDVYEAMRSAVHERAFVSLLQACTAHIAASDATGACIDPALASVVQSCATAASMFVSITAPVHVAAMDAAAAYIHTCFMCITAGLRAPQEKKSGDSNKEQCADASGAGGDAAPSEGTGMGDGDTRGAADVSDALTNEAQLEGTQRPENDTGADAPQSDATGKEAGVEMSTDVDATAETHTPGQDAADDEAGDAVDDEVELDRVWDDVEKDTGDRVDESMWNNDDPPPKSTDNSSDAVKQADTTNGQKADASTFADEMAVPSDAETDEETDEPPADVEAPNESGDAPKAGAAAPQRADRDAAAADSGAEPQRQQEDQTMESADTVTGTDEDGKIDDAAAQADAAAGMDEDTTNNNNDDEDKGAAEDALVDALDEASAGQDEQNEAADDAIEQPTSAADGVDRTSDGGEGDAMDEDDGASHMDEEGLRDALDEVQPAVDDARPGLDEPTNARAESTAGQQGGADASTAQEGQEQTAEQSGQQAARARSRAGEQARSNARAPTNARPQPRPAAGAEPPTDASRDEVQPSQSQGGATDEDASAREAEAAASAMDARAVMAALRERVIRSASTLRSDAAASSAVENDAPADTNEDDDGMQVDDDVRASAAADTLVAHESSNVAMLAAADAAAEDQPPRDHTDVDGNTENEHSRMDTDDAPRENGRSGQQDAAQVLSAPATAGNDVAQAAPPDELDTAAHLSDAVPSLSHESDAAAARLENRVHTQPLQEQADADAMVDDEPLPADVPSSAVAAAAAVYAEPVTLSSAAQTWMRLSSLTHSHATRLCETLRLILTPTRSSALGGAYKSGKRLHMRRVMAYIASSYVQDKIWLRRVRPSARTYQIMLAVDDSTSMHVTHSHAGVAACTALTLICNALSRLDVGEVGVASFGTHTRIITPLTHSFNESTGAHTLSQLTFTQQHTRTNVAVRELVSHMIEARAAAHTQSRAFQLIFMLTDGIVGAQAEREDIRRSCAWARENGCIVVALLMDASKSPEAASASVPGSAAGHTSIMDLQSVRVDSGRVVRTHYMDDYPFPFYAYVRDVSTLPETLADALRQWIELCTRE